LSVLLTGASRIGAPAPPFNIFPPAGIFQSVKGTGTDPSDDRPDDESLVALARQGRPGAVESLVARHQGVVYRFLLGLLSDEEEAADAAQDTFVRALSNLDGFRGDSAFRTWLLAIARNEARASLRRRVRRREARLDEAPQLPAGGAGPERSAIRAAEIERVQAALRGLPEKQRLSVSLRLFDGLSFREVAELTDSTEGAARVNYHHGIRRLREWLDESES
jgi:RNA polymerase sigma-70 factor, ECF subfamily